MEKCLRTFTHVHACVRACAIYLHAHAYVTSGGKARAGRGAPARDRLWRRASRGGAPACDELQREAGRRRVDAGRPAPRREQEAAPPRGTGCGNVRAESAPHPRERQAGGGTAGPTVYATFSKITD